MQFITFRLHDSVPASVIEQWKLELRWHEGLAADSKEAVELRKRIERYADSGYGACYLRDERIAQLVQDALKYFDGKYYRLIAWCIMPNHVHVLIQMKDVSLSKIIHSWKSYTAKEANKLLGRKGQFWAPDYFDRYIRDEKHYHATVNYILYNPVKAKLVSKPEDWPWSGYCGRPEVSEPRDEQESNDAMTNQRIAFLKAHPALVLDTRHFSRDFTARLLASFENLDEMTDGLLVHSENWQALNLLLEKYRERVKTIYIDPPYNSKTTEILYKNNYKHSSWLTLIENRLELIRHYETKDGSHVIAIDENEQERLGLLLEKQLPNHTKICVSIVHNKKGIQGDYFSYNHDFAYFCISPGLPETNGKPIPEDEWEYMNLRKWGRESERHTAKNCFYPIYVQGDKIIGFGEVCPDDFHPYSSNVVVDERKQIIAVYPVDSQGVERKWRYSRQSVEQIRHLLKVHVTTNGEIQILKARDKAPFKTVWDDPRYIAGDFGTRWLTDLGLKISENLYPKSVYTVQDSLFAVSDQNAFCLDFFAGSGTTGHAVINLNREDGGRRKFILVEMGEYFDTVLLPRIKKVTFTPEWKDGKPKRVATQEEFERGPRIVKVIRLESYEDALNNITFDEESGQQALQMFGREYLLRYMLHWESKKSETFLDVEKLQSPFSYKLRIHRDGETREVPVDLPETFAYLIGLDVERRQVFYDGDRCYLVHRGTTRDGRKVAVIWRETKGWTKEDYERDAKFVTGHGLTEGSDEIFINGDSYISGVRSLDGIFKARLFHKIGNE